MTYRLICVFKESEEYTKDVLGWFQALHPGFEVLPLKFNYPGWWAKMELFRPDIKGDILYCDLDTIIRGDYTIFSNLEDTYVLSDFYNPDKSIGSGLMYLKEEDRAQIWRDWTRDPLGHMMKHRGDQDYLNSFLWYAKRFQTESPGKVLSYKKHIDKTAKKYEAGYDYRDADVICFHGKPRPWEVEWKSLL